MKKKSFFFVLPHDTISVRIEDLGLLSIEKKEKKVFLTHDTISVRIEDWGLFSDFRTT